jgi:L-alanine-DL-glutamate epimerase-like enolase superfamily enzyme
MKCDDGSYGIGFCGGGDRFNGLATVAIRELLAPELIGQDPHRTEGLWRSMYHKILINGRAGAAMRALSALDIALWDRNARSASLPLAKYLGSYCDDVKAYASGGYYPPGDLVANVKDEASRYQALGFDAVKIKVGGADPVTDGCRAQGVREVIGPTGILMLDANNAWSDLPTALRAIQPLLTSAPYFIEEPFWPDDRSNFLRLSKAVSTPLAAGEIGSGRWEFKDLIEAAGVSVLQPDATVCGGITEWRRIAATAASHGVAIAPHSYADIHVHLAATAPNALFVEYFPTNDIFPFRLLIDNPVASANGRLVVSSRAGLGFDFNEDFVKRNAVDNWC